MRCMPIIRDHLLDISKYQLSPNMNAMQIFTSFCSISRRTTVLVQLPSTCYTSRTTSPMHDIPQDTASHEDLTYRTSSTCTLAPGAHPDPSQYNITAKHHEQRPEEAAAYKSVALNKFINSLPVEVIGEIFVHCLPPGDPHQRVPDPSKAPLLLCQVCSLWRSIAFGVPQLWDTLSLQSSGNLPSIVLKNSLDIASLWFGNARNVLLSLSIDIYDTEGDDYGDLESILLSYSNQFCYLDLRMCSECNLARFLSLPSGHLANLEYLRLIISTLEHNANPITAFASAPRLKKALISVDDGWPSHISIPTYMLLPWAQLTYLEIGAAISYTRWSHLFLHCPLLEHSDVSYDYTDMTAPAIAAIQHPLVMRSLATMSFTILSHASPSDFYMANLDIAFPALEAFEARHCFINAELIRTFAQPLRYHVLRRLSLHRNTISVVDLLEFLRATVSLVELSLWLNISKDVDHRVLWSALAYGNKGDVLVNLEIFDLWMWVYEGDFYPLECARMIESRWDVRALEGAYSSMAFCSLRRVLMHMHPDQGRVKLMSDLLEKYKIEGLDVSVDSRQNLESWSKQW